MNTKIAIKYGSITGLVIMASWVISYFIWGGVHFPGGEVFGYAVMLLAFSTVFVAIRNKKMSSENGISFKDGFLTGLGIVLVATIIYVIGWTFVYMPAFEPDFVERFQSTQIDKVNQLNISEDQKAAQINDIKSFNETYKKPHIMAMFTFIEIFPVGLIVSLICALILKRKA